MFPLCSKSGAQYTLDTVSISLCPEEGEERRGAGGGGGRRSGGEREAECCGRGAKTITQSSHRR